MYAALHPLLPCAHTTRLLAVTAPGGPVMGSLSPGFPEKLLFIMKLLNNNRPGLNRMDRPCTCNNRQDPPQSHLLADLFLPIVFNKENVQEIHAFPAAETDTLQIVKSAPQVIFCAENFCSACMRFVLISPKRLQCVQ